MKTLEDKYIIKIQSSKEDEEAVGTGFFITSSGYILTCHHVVAETTDKTTDYWVSWSSQSEPVHVEYCDELSSKEMDFAILKISTNDISFDINILNFDICDNYEKIEKIEGKGYQTKNYGDSSTPSPASAEILGRKTINGNNFLILKDAVNVSQGLSGSPALNKKTGKIIGMFVKQLLEKETINDTLYPIGKQVVILPLHEITRKLSNCNITGDVKLFIESVNYNHTEIYLFVKKNTCEDAIVACIEWIFPEEKESLKYYVQIKSYASKETVKSLDDYLENVHLEKVSKVKLKDLAFQGSHLFDLLFSSFYHRSSDIEAAKKSKKYISNIINTSNYKIFIESGFDIPWNCLYVKDPLDGIESEYFIGNSCRIAIINPFQGFSCEKNKYSNYAAHDYDIKQLYELRNIIKNKFDKIFYLECSDKKRGNRDEDTDSKISIINCQSLDDFCDAIIENIPKLLFICFDEGFIVNSNANNSQAKTSCIKIGDIELPVNKLKERLSIIEGKPIFVIIVGRKSNYDVRVEFKKLFIMDLKWNGMIFMDGNMPLDFAIEYLCHFVDEFTKGHSISETMFDIREKYKNDTKKNNIGLAFTAYFNKFDNGEINT